MRWRTGTSTQFGSLQNSRRRGEKTDYNNFHFPGVLGFWGFGVLGDDISKTPCFVYEYMPNTETKLLIPTLEDFDIRLYLYKILKALDYSHSHGIMHRDVKPLNIVINH